MTYRQLATTLVGRWSGLKVSLTMHTTQGGSRFLEHSFEDSLCSKHVECTCVEMVFDMSFCFLLWEGRLQMSNYLHTHCHIAQTLVYTVKLGLCANTKTQRCKSIGSDHRTTQDTDGGMTYRGHAVSIPSEKIKAKVKPIPWLSALIASQIRVCARKQFLAEDLLGISQSSPGWSRLLPFHVRRFHLQSAFLQPGGC